MADSVSFRPYLVPRTLNINIHTYFTIERAFGSFRDDVESAQSSVVAALPVAQTAGPTSA